MTTAIVSLARIAEDLNDLHEIEAQQSTSLMETWIRKGELLCNAKSQLNHGEWIPWVEDNLPFDVRQSQKYMRIYSSRKELNTNSNSHLAIDEAVQMLATPKPKPETFSDLPEDDGDVVDTDFVEDESDEDVIEVEATPRARFDYGELCDTARRICSSTQSLYTRIVEFQVKCKQMSRSGKDAVGRAWNKKEWDDLFSEVAKMNKMFRKES